MASGYFLNHTVMSLNIALARTINKYLNLPTEKREESPSKQATAIKHSK